MTLDIFRCSIRQTRTGVRPGRTSRNLPATAYQGGNWVFWQTIDVNPRDPGRRGAPPEDEILAAIARDEYYINDASIEFTETQL